MLVLFFVVYPFNLFISVIKDLGLSTTKVGEILDGGGRRGCVFMRPPLYYIPYLCLEPVK